MPTQVIHIRDYKNGDLYCGRQYGKWKESPFHNPHRISDQCTRLQSVCMFERDFLQNGQLMILAYQNLRGKRLACWCAPKLCHCHVIANFVDSILIPNEDIKWANDLEGFVDDYITDNSIGNSIDIKTWRIKE